MDSAYKTAADAIFDNNLEDYDGILKVLQQFYRQRSAEIISELDDRGLMLERHIKIGGTD